MQDGSTSVARRLGEEHGRPTSDPVGLARNILLLPRGRARHDLILFLRTLAPSVDREEQKFLLASPPPGIPEAYISYALSFLSMGVSQRNWVLDLVDTVVGKSQSVTLLNAGYGGYPLFSEWSKAVRRAESNGWDTVAPDEAYGPLNIFGKDAYIDVVETIRLYEDLYLDAMEALRLDDSTVPAMEEVCFQERIPVLSPSLIADSENEKKLSVVTGGYISANKMMFDILEPFFDLRGLTILRGGKIAGVSDYLSAIITTEIILFIIYNLLISLSKRPRAVPETALASPTTPAWDDLLVELENSGIPPAIWRKPQAAYREIEKELGPDETALKTDDMAVRLLTPSEGDKLVACEEESLDAVQAWAEQQRNEREWIEGILEQGEVKVVSPLALRDHLSTLLDEVTKRKTSFLIKRQRKLMAALVAPPKDAVIRGESIISTRFLIENRSLLDKIHDGEKFWLSKRNAIVAALIPPPPTAETYLSASAIKR